MGLLARPQLHEISLGCNLLLILLIVRTPGLRLDVKSDPCPKSSYPSIQFFLGEISCQLQIQNCVARRSNFHYRDRSVGVSAENLLLQKIQILS